MIAAFRHNKSFRLQVLLLAMFSPLLAGCSGSAPTTKFTQSNGVTPLSAPKSSVDFVRARGGSGSMGSMGGMLGNAQPVEVFDGSVGASIANAPAKDTPISPIDRKILYTADLELVTEDLSKFEAALIRLVKQNGGYIADTDITGSTGNSRSSRWKVRIPAEKFDTFVDSGVKLGELTRRQINSQDVTEEFYDLEARIKNKKVEETRLLKHLQETTAKLQDILLAEKELSRVREEVERQEGRLRLLANLATLTTVTIHASERMEFVPATAPGFTTRASRAFNDSVTGLIEFFQFVALWLLSILPWLPLWLVLGVIVLVLMRRVRRRIVAYIQRPRPATL